MDHRRSNGGIRSSVMSNRKESSQWVVGSGQYELNRRDFLRETIAFALPPTAYCLLPTAYCLLPTAYCLLPTAYCLLPTALSQSADAWPQFRGNYNNTRVSPPQPPPDLKPLWT